MEERIMKHQPHKIALQVPQKIDISGERSMMTFLRQVHRVVISNNLFLRTDIKPTRNN